MSENINSLINTITVGTSIKGDIQANGDFRMDGTLEGNITLTGKLVIGEHGHILGNVVCQNANVLGNIDGNLSVKEFLTLYATSRVKGDIVANKLAIEPGAYFTGSCHMLDELSE
jgi:cytoskeletal protein CcmA (bactofilin family)